MTATRQPSPDEKPGVSVRLRGDRPGSRELLEALRRENDQLQTALTTRIVIEQAKGMLAERLAVEVDEAFDRLRREARNRRIKLHTIAAAVVTREAWTGPLFRTDQRGNAAPGKAPAKPGADAEARGMAKGTGKREIVRAVNERIRLVAQPFGEISGGETRADFVCECSDEACFAVVPMTRAEWRAATTEANYFVVRPEHMSADDQAVVATDRYAVVRSARPGEPTYRQAESGALERP